MGAGRRWGALAACLLAAAGARAEDPENGPVLPEPNFPYKTVTTKEGLVFRVPADMPVEMRDGIQAPIPFDEYVYGKFQDLQSKISRLDKRLSKIEAKLDRIAAAAAPAAPPPSSAENDTGILKAGAE